MRTGGSSGDGHARQGAASEWPLGLDKEGGVASVSSARRRHRPDQLRGDPRGGEWLAARSRGVLAHRAVAAVAALSAPGDRELTVAVSAVLRELDSHSPALRRRLTEYAAGYLANFRPPPAWQLAGVEVVVAGVRFDLLFERAGWTFADELKTGWAAVDRAQLEAQAAAGVERFGERFVGVRVVLLDRREALWFGPHGEEAGDEDLARST